MPVWWNIVQACVWVATREQGLVDRVRTADTTFNTPDTISDRSLYDAGTHVGMRRTQQGHGWGMDVDDAKVPIAEACAAGALSMLGRKRAAGDPELISQVTWAHLEVRDHPQYGVIVASPDMFDNKASWWDELRVSSDAMRKLWPDQIVQAAALGTSLLEQTRDVAEPSRASEGAATSVPVSAEIVALSRMTQEVLRRRESGEPHGREELVAWLKGEMPDVGERQGRRIFKEIPAGLRKQRLGRRPGKPKSGQI